MYPVTVSVVCTVYNHGKYLRDCLDGFVMQKTDFPFEVLIHDDASTDDSPEIIKEYEARYPDLFVPILQTENQYSRGIPIGQTYLYPKVRGKYIAECEGDDYWIDPNKLQMQVDYMESHPECSMCCSNAVVVHGEEELDWTIFKEDSIVTLDRVLSSGGIFIQTATYLYRSHLRINYPDYCRNCYVGDYPLLAWCASNGSVMYFSKKTAVYRYMHPGSWTEKYQSRPILDQIKDSKTWINLFEGINAYTNGRCEKIVRERQAHAVFVLMKDNPEHIKTIEKEFAQILPYMNVVQRLDLLVYRYHLESLLALYKKFRSLLFRR